jgi:hypothetical protein
MYDTLMGAFGVPCVGLWIVAVRLVEQNVCASVDLFHAIEECRVAAEDNRPVHGSVRFVGDETVSIRIIPTAMLVLVGGDPDVAVFVDLTGQHFLSLATFRRISFA